MDSIKVREAFVDYFLKKLVSCIESHNSTQENTSGSPTTTKSKAAKRSITILIKYIENYKKHTISSRAAATAKGPKDAGAKDGTSAAKSKDRGFWLKVTVENPILTKENAKNPKRSLWSTFTRQAPRKMKVTTNVWGGMSPTYASSQDPPLPSSGGGGGTAQLLGFTLSSGGATPDADTNSSSSSNAGDSGSNETLELGGLSEQSTVGELRNRLGCELYKVSRMNYGETFGLPPPLTKMHLFWKGSELRGEGKTLKQLRITAGSTILAKFAMVSQKASVSQLRLGTEDFLLYKYYKAASEAPELEGSKATGPRLTLVRKKKRRVTTQDETDVGEEEEVGNDSEGSGKNDGGDKVEMDKAELTELTESTTTTAADDDWEDSADAPAHILASSAMFNKLTHMFLKGELRFPEGVGKLRGLCLELLNLVPSVSRDIAEELIVQPQDMSFTQEEDRYMYLYRLLLIDTYIKTGKRAAGAKGEEFQRICEKFEAGGGVDMLADVILPCAISKHDAEVELGNVLTIYKLIIVHTISILHYFVVERSGGAGAGAGVSHRGILSTPFMEQCFCVLKIISPGNEDESGGSRAGAGTTAGTTRTGEAFECASVLCTIDIICECIQENPDESLNVLFSSTGIRSSLIYTVPAILNKYSPTLRSRIAQGLLAVFERILDALELLNYTFENDSLLDFFLHVVEEAEKSKSASESFFALFDALVRSRLFPADVCLAFFAEKLLHYNSSEASFASPPDIFLGGILTLIASSLPRPDALLPLALSSSSSATLSAMRAKRLLEGCGQNGGTSSGGTRKLSVVAMEAATVGLAKALVEELYENCLVRVSCDTTAFPKCKTPESRARAYAALRSVLRVTPVLAQQLTAALIRHVDALDLNAGWNYPAPAEESGLESGGGGCGRDGGGNGANGGGSSCAVGLRNLGATCYINAILQQLYMTAEFRDYILSVEDCPRVPMNGVDFDMLFQLQNLFSAMQLQNQQRRLKPSMRKRSVDTTQFCQTLRNSKNEPISTYTQMDAIEFYAALMDRTETAVRRLEGESGALQGILQVVLTTQIVCCENPAHVSEHEEAFYSLNVDVKGRRSLRESLAELTRGETLRGEDQYFCGYCGKKVDALKRYFFKTIPRTLVVHLKRFEFHIGRLKVIKLNDSYEFPLELDLAPFTDASVVMSGPARQETIDAPTSTSPPISTARERRPSATNDSAARYRLSGIVVHNGTTDEGHYYSLRRVQLSPASSVSNRETEEGEEVWLELNDSTVTPFDPKDIPEKCYGGPDPARNGLKAYSAYILFYDKLESDEPDSESEDSDGGGGGTGNLPLVAAPSKEGKAASTPATPEMAAMPAPFFSPPPSTVSSPRARASDMLRREQALAARYRFLCGPQHMAFVWGLAHELPDRLQGFKLLLYVLVNVVARMGDRLALFPRWFAAVKGFLCPASPPAGASAQECARWLLRALIADKGLWRNMLHECPVPMVRLAFIDVVVTAFRLVSHEEQPLYGAAVAADPPNVALSVNVWTSSAVNGSREDGSLAILFIDNVLDSFEMARLEYGRDRLFYVLVYEIASTGPKEREFLLFKRDFLRRAFAFAFSFNGGSPFSPPMEASAAPPTSSPAARRPKSPTGISNIKALVHLFEAVHLLTYSLSLPTDVAEAFIKSHTQQPQHEENSQQQQQQHQSTQQQQQQQHKPTQTEFEILSRADGYPEAKHDRESVDLVLSYADEMLKNGCAVHCAISLALYLCVQARDAFVPLLGIIQRALESPETTRLGFRRYAKFATVLLSIDDENLPWRVDLFMRMFLRVLKRRVTSPRASVELTTVLLENFAAVCNRCKPLTDAYKQTYKPQVEKLLKVSGAWISFE